LGGPADRLEFEEVVISNADCEYKRKKDFDNLEERKAVRR